MPKKIKRFENDPTYLDFLGEYTEFINRWSVSELTKFSNVTRQAVIKRATKVRKYQASGKGVNKK